MILPLRTFDQWWATQASKFPVEMQLGIKEIARMGWEARGEKCLAPVCVPVSMQAGVPCCNSSDCPYRAVCANHETASRVMSRGYSTPGLYKIGNEWLCDRSPVGRGRRLANGDVSDA
jgi:hypothetical protein